jgi:hypothetical protein
MRHLKATLIAAAVVVFAWIALRTLHVNETLATTWADALNKATVDVDDATELRRLLHFPRSCQTSLLDPGFASFQPAALLRDLPDVPLIVNQPLAGVADPWLYTYEDRREPLPPSKFRVAQHRETEMSLSAAFELAQSSRGFVYVSAKLSNSSALGQRALRDWPLLRATAQQLCASDDVSQLAWLGNVNSTAGWHYDNTANIYVMISGRKRWQLARPQSRLTFFPDLHMHARQLIGDVDSGVIDIVLEAGDVLLIPPFYLHRVQTLSGSPVSVAINTWCSSSAAERQYALARSVLPPIDVSWPRPQVLLATKIFLDELVRAVGVESSFVRDSIVVGQYLAWLEDADDAVRESFTNAVDAFGGCRFSARTVELTRTSLLPQFRKALEHQATAFARIENAEVRRLLLARFAQRFVLSVLVDVEHVFPFFALCFDAE